MNKTFDGYIKEDNMKIPTFEELWDLLPNEVSIPNWKRGEGPKKINIKKELEDTIQDSKHHPEGSVKKHMELIYRQIIHNFSNDEHIGYLILSNMFHDIAKPEATEHSFRQDGSKKITHIGHEHIAVKYMDLILVDYVHALSKKFPDIFGKMDKNIDLDIVRNTVKDHMRSHLYFNTINGTSSQPVNLKKDKWVNFPNEKHYPVLKKFAHSDENGRYRTLEDSEEPEESKEDELGNKLGFIKKDYHG